jgi:hypothetical protein
MAQAVRGKAPPRPGLGRFAGIRLPCGTGRQGGRGCVDGGRQAIGGFQAAIDDGIEPLRRALKRPDDRMGGEIRPNSSRWCLVEHRKSRSYSEHPKRQIGPFRPLEPRCTQNPDRENAGCGGKSDQTARGGAWRSTGRAEAIPSTQSARSDRFGRPNRAPPRSRERRLWREVRPNSPRWCLVEHRKSRSYSEHPKRQIGLFRLITPAAAKGVT